MKRVFLVDDHPAIRHVYAEVIKEADDLTVCGTAASFAEAIEAIPVARPEVALIDISLGREGPDGLELIRRLHASVPGDGPRWLVVSAHDDQAFVRQARDVGANGFLSKRDAGGRFIAAIRSVLGDTGDFFS